MRGRSWINDYAPNFPEIVEEVRKLPVEACVLDSELTLFKKGTDKDIFISALAGPEIKKGHIAKAMVFDVLYVEDFNVEDLPFTDRQEILEELVPDPLSHVDVVETVSKGKKAFFQRIGKKEGEGVVLKERKSPYTEGARSSDWLKVRHWRSEDVVVVGYTKGEGARASTFGSLVLAQKDKKGDWRYVGKSSGFKNRELTRLLQKMKKLQTSRNPFKKGEGPAEKEVQAWIKPKTVIEVRYYEKTPKGKLRFPDYTRERYDKKPDECTF